MACGPDVGCVVHTRALAAVFAPLGAVATAILCTVLLGRARRI
jgi:hypothetical protein